MTRPTCARCGTTGCLPTGDTCDDYATRQGQAATGGGDIFRRLGVRPAGPTSKAASMFNPRPAVSGQEDRHAQAVRARL